MAIFRTIWKCCGWFLVVKNKKSNSCFEIVLANGFYFQLINFTFLNVLSLFTNIFIHPPCHIPQKQFEMNNKSIKNWSMDFSKLNYSFCQVIWGVGITRKCNGKDCFKNWKHSKLTIDFLLFWLIYVNKFDIWL